MAVPFVRLYVFVYSKQLPVFQFVVIADLSAWKCRCNNEPTSSETIFSVTVFQALMDVVFSLLRPLIEKYGVIDFSELV